jgi:peroxiredoxin
MTSTSRSVVRRCGAGLVCCVVLVLAAPIVVAQDPPEEEPPPEQPTTIIEGQVFDLMGVGVKDATVVGARPAEGTAEPVELARTSTNETGDFVLSLPGRVAGKVIVTITKKGYAEATREVEVEPDAEFPPFVDVELSGKAMLLGVVRDFHSDEPVADARIEVESLFRTWTDETDAEGAFQLENLPPGPAAVTVKADGFGHEKLDVVIGVTNLRGVKAEGFGNERLQVDSVEKSGHLIVKLKPERVVHLVVHDHEGTPIPGVSVESIDDAREDFRSRATDDQGKLTLRGVHYDVIRMGLRLTHTGFVSSSDFDREIVLPAEPLESTHTLVMEPAGSVTGKIVDRATGQPLHGARVAAGESPVGQTPRAWSTYDGSYTIDGVPPGKRAVTVHLAGHAPDMHEVEVVAGKKAVQNFELQPGSRVGGLVVDGDGKPIRGAYVVASQWRGHESLGLQAMTDQDGRFVIGDAPHDEFAVVIRHPQYETLEGQTIAAPKMDYRFELAPAERQARPDAKFKIGDPAPAFELVTLEGKPIRSKDLEGKTVLLDFWATWCVPCVAEIPQLKAVHEAFGKRDDFVMIGINSDQEERTLRRFIKDRKIEWPQVFGPEKGVKKISDDFGVKAIPATFVINPEGKIQLIDPRAKTLKEEIEKILRSFEPA